MEFITVNLAGGVRRETLDGRAYLVAPVTMIVPGVLNGSKGPLLYPLDEMTPTYLAWNGMPIVAPIHPIDGQGNPVSARSPQTWQKFGVGNIYNTGVSGRLTAEAWVDIEKANSVDPRIVNSMLRGEKLEVSTGLAVSFDETPGVWNGTVPYTAVARNFRPDHLAILLDQKGACSTAHGCGINNAEGKTVDAIMNCAGCGGACGATCNNKEARQSLWNRLGEILLGTKSAVELTNTLPQTSVPNDAKADSAFVTNQDATMKLTPEQRAEIINALVATDTWKGQDEKLNTFEDVTLNALGDGMKAAKKAKQEEEMRMKEEEMRKKMEPIANAATAGFKIGDTVMVINEKGEVIKKDETPANTNNGASQVKPIELKDLPAEVQNAIAYGNARMKEDKDELIRIIVANVAEDERQAKIDFLGKKDIAELETIASLLPPAPAHLHNNGDHYELDDEPTQRRGRFAGMNVSNSRNSSTKKQEPMPVQNMDFSDNPLTKKHRKTG